MTLDPARDFEILEDAREQMHGDHLRGGPTLVGVTDERTALRSMIDDLRAMSAERDVARAGAMAVDAMIARMEHA